ncbi:MAG: NADPH-dependent glutamate synthase [Erysipelotrichaceae bacterium]
MANMSLKKIRMPHQEPSIRSMNFDEVALGYDEEMAVEEANRCLHCINKPCMNGCPVHVNIPEFIEDIKNRKFEDAYQKIKATSSLPGVCGRVCPQESQCEKYCVRGIKGEAVAIGRLERFVADYHSSHVQDEVKKIASNHHKVAIVGSGPASLTCAGDLAMLGYEVVVYEALHEAGGVLIYGIPEFRLPKKIVHEEVENLKKLGVEINTNMVIGKILEIDELFEMGYEAVFIGSGAGLPSFMNMPGENLKGVYSANEFLTRINLMKAYKENVDTPIIKASRVAVVGGGNVAMDAARCAKRLGVEEVSIVYRRSMEELPARREEVEHASEEGIKFKLLCNPKRVLGDEQGWVKGMECVEMTLGEADASGRARPIEKIGSEFILDIDCMIMAIGTSPNPLIRSTTKGLEANKRGCIIADEHGATSRKGVFAGGDAVSGAATVILAMGAGKQSAKAIDEYIQNNEK